MAASMALIAHAKHLHGKTNANLKYRILFTRRIFIPVNPSLVNSSMLSRAK